MEDDLTKLSRTTATEDQENGLPDRLDDSSVSSCCLQLLSVEDNPGIKQLMLVLRLRHNRLQRTENIGNS